MADIFRKKLLDKLSSPEQLDKMIIINSPMVWISLIGGAFMIAAVVLWGIWGRIPVTEDGNGILLREGTVSSVYAGTQGVVVKSYISGGETVEAGDILYEVSNQEALLQVQNVKERIEKVEAVTYDSENDVATSDNQTLITIKNQKLEMYLEERAYEMQLEELQENYQRKQDEIAALKEKSDLAEIALYDGISGDTDAARNSMRQNAFQQALSNYNTAKTELKSLETQIDTIKLRLSAEKESREVHENALRNQFDSAKEAVLNDLNRELEKYRLLTENMKIKSTAGGVVYSTFVTNGSAVTVDTEVARINVSEKDTKMQAVYYMNLGEGKKVEEGMTVNIYPTTLAKEEYGHMTGTVIKVADYVTSYAGLYTRVGDSILAETFSKNGAMVEVVCEIKTDENSVNGYAWSTRKGSEVELQEGTLLTGRIVIRTVPPITMLIPKLKEKLNLE